MDTQKSPHCFYTIFLKNNSTNEGKCCFVFFTSWLKQIFLIQAHISFQPLKMRVWQHITNQTQLFTNESARTIQIINCYNITKVKRALCESLIDHSVLLDELRSFNIDQTLFFWIRSFLPLCRHGNNSTGGVPQGTKLGLTILAVMDKQAVQELAFANKVCRWHYCNRDYPKTPLVC